MIRRSHGALLLGAALTITACGGDSTGPEPAPVVAAPASLAIVTSPATTIAVDEALQPAPVIELRDAAGKPVAKAGVAVSATLINGTATGTTTATTGANGRATFQGIIVSGPLGAHELRFSSTGLSSASLAITLISGAPAGMTAASAQLQNAAAGANAPEAPAVHLVDADGNPVPGAAVQFTVLGGGGHVGVPAPVTNASGVATAGAWTLGAGLNLLQAVSGADTVLFRAGGASSPAQSVVAASRTTQTIVTGQELSEQPAVKVLGEGGTPVAGALVVFGGVSGLALLDDSLAVTNEEGVATAGHWRVVAASEQRLISSVPATSLDSIHFNVTAVQSGTLAARSWVENQILESGAALETAPAVVVASGGKPLAGVAVTFSVTSGGGSPATATVITNASGIAQVPGWALGAASGLQVMTARAPGFTPENATFHVFVVEALPARIEMVAGDGQSAVILTPLAIDPAVKVTDAAGNPIVGYPVQFVPAKGTVADSAPETNASGIATSGHWTMPRGASPGLTLTVRADDLEGSPLLFHATSLSGPPAALHPSTTPLQGIVGGASTLPSLLVLDAEGNPVPGVPVTASVDHGSVTHPGVTDSSGNWRPTAWILGTKAGDNSLIVTVDGFDNVLFTSTALPGPLAGVITVGDLQTGPAYSSLPELVGVRAEDQYGNGIPNLAITFTTSGDARMLPGAGTVTTNSSGFALLNWRMGSALGSYTLTATIPDAPSLTQTVTATATSVVSGFDIDVRYVGTPSAAMVNAVTAAVARWRAIVLSDLPSATIDRGAGECFDSQPAINETVDDILIYVETNGIDDVGGILGAAGPCLLRGSSRMPIVGYMHLDAADVAQLAATGQLQDVVLHEMGHILGIGSLWEDRNLLLNAGSIDPRYIGQTAVTGYHELGGQSATVPVENTGGTGTADSHWREETFGSELMTGYISSADNALSRLTIDALLDLGYTVSYSPAERLTLAPGALAQLRTRPRRLIERTLPSPIIVVDQAGRELGRERRLR